LLFRAESLAHSAKNRKLHLIINTYSNPYFLNLSTYGKLNLSLAFPMD
jgi:hypothetical protein